MTVCVIPARGGSKRIPRKNIKPFDGKPIIAYSIDAAKKSKCFERIIVSTDDDEIASISQDYGAEIPFLRPKELSDDYTSTSDVIKHAIKFLDMEAFNFNFVCCIYPTAPLIDFADIQKTKIMLDNDKASFFCFPVCEFPSAVQRALKSCDGKANMFYPQYFSSRTQDLERAFFDAGQFYWGKKEGFLTDRAMFSRDSIIHPIDRKKVIDIDTDEDWAMAEFMHRFTTKV